MKTIRLNEHASLCDLETGGLKPALLVLPGGGYFTLTANEGIPVGEAFAERGFHSYVLYYSTLETNPDRCCYEEAFHDLEEAVRYIHNHNGQKVFLLGFSAGGHLSAMYGNNWKKTAVSKGEDPADLQVNGMVLGYPALAFGTILMEHPDGLAQKEQERLMKFKQAVSMGLFHKNKPDIQELDSMNAWESINEDTPPAFVWGTLKDEIIDPCTLLKYAEKMKEAGRECEVHLYAGGTHGMSLANESTATSQRMMDPHISGWVDLACDWMKEKAI